MPPFRFRDLAASHPSQMTQNGNPIDVAEASQWTNSGDILSLLLLVGGDVIQCAIAQLAGDRKLPTLVVFSFGWLAYTFTALLSVVGDHRLMPSTPNLPSILISTSYGHVWTDKSWILGRLLRDYEHWMPSRVRRELDYMLAQVRRPKAGLCVSVFEADPDKAAGQAQRDLLWYSGYLVAFVQLLVAVLQWIVPGEWDAFAVTAAGKVLTFASASLPQWRRERRAYRRQSSNTVCLTQDDGAQHALVIMGAGHAIHKPMNQQ